jgi:hypothetical protein
MDRSFNLEDLQYKVWWTRGVPVELHYEILLCVSIDFNYKLCYILFVKQASNRDSVSRLRTKSG